MLQVDLMRAPIFVVSDDDYVFESIEAAERYFESPEAGDLKAFDRDGVILAVTVERTGL